MSIGKGKKPPVQSSVWILIRFYLVIDDFFRRSLSKIFQKVIVFLVKLLKILENQSVGLSFGQNFVSKPSVQFGKFTVRLVFRSD